MNRGQARAQRVLLAWLVLGAAAFALLPWYFPQNLTLWKALPGVFGGSETASGLVHALRHGRPWLWTGLAGLAIGLVAWRLRPGRGQGWMLLAGSALGLAGLVGSGFTIGATGWSFEVLNGLFGELPNGQFGIGLGGALMLLALLMLLGAGIARLGYFRGDFFIAGAVVFCSALLLLFVALPVGKSLIGAFLTEDGGFSLMALATRLGHERVWGLGCLAGGVRCGVAWNTLFLALLTAAGTTVMGTLIALYAERGNRRFTKPLNVLALLPIITPPFVVGLGLILLFGRAGLVNQFLEWAFGITPTRWFYGLFGVWLAQMFAFTPIAFMIMRGVVQGISPSMEEAAQTLRASRLRTFTTVTLPLMKPGLANAFLVGFIESIADFGNPIVVGGQYAVLSTDIFFAIVGAQYDQGRAASLALILTVFALTVFFIQQKVLGRTSYTTVSGKGDAGVAMPLPERVRRLCVGVAGPWLGFTVVVYVFAFIGGFVQTWGRDYTPTLRHFVTAFDLQWGAHGLVWAGTAWNSLFTTLKLAAIAAPICASIGLLISWLLARTQFVGQRAFEFGALLAFAIPGTVLGVSYILAFITPPFVVGLGLILLFGRAGLVNQFLEWAFGITPTRWFYGLFGVWLAQMFAFTPIAFMIMRGVVQGIAPSMEEAAQTLRASRVRTFMTVTLPLMKPGLANAFLVGFIESIADFGNPIVVGGQYAVLSTDIFFAIVGAQYDQGRAASLALILTVFALTVFFIQQKVLGRTSYTTVSGKGDAGMAMPLPDRVRRLAVGVAGPWLAFTVVVYLFAFIGGFVQTWGRDYTPTFKHFITAFDLQWGAHGLVWAGTAWNSLFTTIKLAAIAAPICASIGLLISWLLARTQFVGQRAFEFGALLAFAIPGTVLGVSYILAFNVPPFELTGTGLIIVLCFVFRNLPVGVRAGTASFKQLDKSLDEASTMLRASTATTLRRVVLPLLKPALVAALVYSFVRSMTTVSAVIFLVTAENELATTYIIGRVGNGDYGVALAYCTVLIVLMSLATAFIQFLVGERKLGRRKAVA